LSPGPRRSTPGQIPVAAPNHVAFYESATVPWRPGQPDRTCCANHIWSVARRLVRLPMLGLLEYLWRGQATPGALWYLGGEADVDRRTTTPAAAHRLYPLAARHLRLPRPHGLSAHRRFVRSLWRLRQSPGENSRPYEEGRQELDGELHVPAACRGSAHPGWADGQSSGSYGASVDRPEFVSADLKRFPLDHGGPLRSQLMVGQYDSRIQA